MLDDIVKYFSALITDQFPRVCRDASFGMLVG